MATKKRDRRIIEKMLETARGLQGAGLITKRRMGEFQALSHLAALMRADGDVVGDRGTRQLGHRTGLELIAGQIAVLRVQFQQPLAFQRPPDAQRQSLGQPGKLATDTESSAPAGESAASERSRPPAAPHSRPCAGRRSWGRTPGVCS